MYMTDFAYDRPIFLVPLSRTYPSSPVLVGDVVVTVVIVIIRIVVVVAAAMEVKGIVPFHAAVLAKQCDTQCGTHSQTSHEQFPPAASDT